MKRDHANRLAWTKIAARMAQMAIKFTKSIVYGCIFLAAMGLSANTFAADNLEQTLDQDRYIDISQIEPGLKGYGLTVFSGTQIERFDVVVVSVLKNYGTKSNAILIRCQDKRFDLARGVQGVSGSPVYFDGRLAGAMAFGWSYSEEPLYGVTPIKEMLRIRDTANRPIDRSADGMTGFVFDRTAYENMMAEKLLDRPQIKKLIVAAGLATERSTGESENYASNQLRPLPMRLVLSGLKSDALENLIGNLPGLNIAAGAAAVSSDGAAAVSLAPGATLTIPLITGDISASILGTVTEVVGNEVYGFGHEWNADGAVSWPMGTGYVHTFVSRKNLSFKLGHAIDIVGTIGADEITGVYGRIGETVPMVPAKAVVKWPGSNQEETFNTQIVRNERVDPILATLALANSIMYKGGLPRDHTINYRIEMRFDGAEPILFENVSSGNQISDIIIEIVSPLGLLLNNPWQSVQLEGIELTAQIEDRTRLAHIRSAQLNRNKFRPGEKIEVHLFVEPQRSGPEHYDISLTLPEDIPDGTYSITVGSDQQYRNQLKSARRNRYMAFNSDDVRRILQERLSINRSRIYLSMALPQTHLAIEDIALENLPQSRRVLLDNDMRKQTTATFRPLISESIPTEYVILGGRNFQIQIERP